MTKKKTTKKTVKKTKPAIQPQVIHVDIFEVYERAKKNDSLWTKIKRLFCRR